MSAGSMTLSPFGSNCWPYVKPPASVPLLVLGFVTVTLTLPEACAGVFAVMLVALTTTTFVAALPPIVTEAPFWKPVPAMVTGVPPFGVPCDGVTEVTVTDGATAVTVTFADFVSEQPALVVTVTLSVSVPAAPAVKVMLLVPLPPVIVPLVMLHA